MAVRHCFFMVDIDATGWLQLRSVEYHFGFGEEKQREYGKIVCAYGRRIYWG